MRILMIDEQLLNYDDDDDDDDDDNDNNNDNNAYPNKCPKCESTEFRVHERCSCDGYTELTR